MTGKRTIMGSVMAAALCLPALVWVSPLAAQTATTGVLSGTVRGTLGAPLDGVEVTLIRGQEGGERVIAASRDGRFHSGFLPPGEYELVAERFGYVPVRVTGIVVRSGQDASLNLTLRESPPPVTEIDRVSFRQVGEERSVLARGEVPRSDLRSLPLEGRELSGALSLWSLADHGQGVQGLPGRFTTVHVDGTRFEPAHHPVLGPGFLDLVALPRLFIQELEFAPHEVDAEWGQGAGSLVRVTTVRGRDQLEVEAFGSALGSGLGSSGVMNGTVPSTYGPDGGVLIRGPLRPDTAHFSFGVHARQTARPLSSLAVSSPSAGESFLELSGDAGLPDDRRLGTQRLATWNVLSTFGRVDWRMGDRSNLSVRSTVGLVRDGDAPTPRPWSVLPMDASEATDMTLAADFFTAIGERGGLEFRASVGSSSRRHGLAGAGLESGALPLTWVQEGGILVGADPRLVGRVERSALRLSPVAHTAVGAHQFKLGVEISTHGYTEEGGEARGTGFAFPDLEAFRELRGLRVRGTGPARHTDFGWTRLQLFLQDQWRPTAGFSVTGSVRLDGERLPWDEVLPSESWTELTGIERAADRGPGRRLAPRLGLEWSPAEGDGWLLRGSTGVYNGEVDPALLGEMLADSGAVRVQRTLGSTGAWPTGSTESGRSFEGARLSLLGPRFEAPRSFASEVGVVRRLTAGTSIHVGLSHRRTESLPRRRDLNLTPGVFAVDQFGRQLRGEVVQEGGVISIVPGSDRRFPGFEVVSALESDGWSEWLGATVGLRHEGDGPLDVEAHYTLSRTRDNLPGFGDGWPVAVGSRVGVRTTEPAWVEGRSDLDAPHRLVVSGSLSLADDPGIRLGALYGFHSGRPFTPGVRDLLDGSNSFEWRHLGPVALPSGAGAEGLDALMGRWPCLRDLVGGPPERNVCRTDTIHELNVSLAVALRGSPRWGLELTVDALNLMDSGPVIPDPAAFTVDGSGSLQTGGGGTIQLPVRVNPGFGEPLVRLSPGRSIRVGLGVRH